jgi:hypothetical protein
MPTMEIESTFTLEEIVSQLAEQVKNEKESFLGVGPGRGPVINHNGQERIVFCVYDNNGLFKDPIFENASAVYTDDNGETWHRSNKIKIKSSIHYLIILGSNNQIFGTDEKCLVDILNIDGNNNIIMLNSECSNVTINDTGNNNNVSFR